MKRSKVCMVFGQTRTFSVGGEREICTGMRIFELAERIGTVRHYIWSTPDNVAKVNIRLTLNTLAGPVCLPVSSCRKSTIIRTTELYILTPSLELPIG